MEFKNKVLIIGYGAVSKCMFPILLRHVNIPLEHITIIDFKDKSADLKAWTTRGLQFYKKKVSPKNLKEILSEHLSPGGLLIDLAWNIDCCEIVQWCHDNNVLYVNTSVEAWDPDSEKFTATPYEKTLYFRQMKLMELTRDWKDATTCVVDHGANPGLISHFAKKGLVDIAERMITDKIAPDPARTRDLIRKGDYATLAMETGIRVIHCSEHDTQISRSPKKMDEFVGTWCIEGLREEGTAPAEIGWGTHEKELPPQAIIPPVGPKNGILLPRMGINTWVRSWIPHQEIVGMVIRHGEAFGISDRWTVWKDGEAIYRPTVHYAYMPCDATIASLHELRARNYELQPKAPDHERPGDRLRCRYPRGTADGPPVQVLVDRQHPPDRRGEETRAGPERDHHPGRARRCQRGDVDDRAPEDGVLPSRRPPARVRPRRSPHLTSANSGQGPLTGHR